MSTLAQDHEALDRMAKFPKGTPADPTKNMTPEQKAEWEAMKDKHGDKFKQANGDMLQYFADNPDKLAEKLERDKAKKNALYPGSPRGTKPLSSKVEQDVWDAGFEAASWARTKGRKQVDGTMLFVDAIHKLRDRRVPNVTEDDPQFWEYVGTFIDGAKAYAKNQVDGFGVRAAGGAKKTAYFTLYITPGLTQWQHPSKTLSRGAFKTKREADQWAEKNIPGEKYTVAEIDDPEVVEKAMIDVLRALVKAGEQGVRVDRLPPVGVRELLQEKVVEAERGVLYRKNPAFDRFVKSLRGVRLAADRAALDEMALMAMDLTEGSLPHVALDRDLAALEHHARLAAIDVSAEQLRMAAPSFAGDGIRWRKNFFKMFFPEKRLRIVWWDLKDKEGTPHHISNQSVLEFINIAPSGEQAGIEKMIRRIDFANGDVNDYLKHLAGALINNPQFAMKVASEWLDRMARHEGLREHMVRQLVGTDEGDMLLSRFEEGESADPTENMSEEDAKKWRLENLKNKDKFKSASGISVGHMKDGDRQTFSAEGVHAHVWFDLQDARNDFGGRATAGEWQVIISTSPDPLNLKPRGRELARQVFRYVEKKAANMVASSASDFIRQSLFKYRGKTADLGDGILAEGCPDNLDEGECAEWESNTEEHKDKFTKAAKGDYTGKMFVTYTKGGKKKKEGPLSQKDAQSRFHDLWKDPDITMMDFERAEAWDGAKKAASGYVVSIAPDGMPQVDGYVDPPLFTMILAKVYGYQPGKVRPLGGKLVDVAGARRTWLDALQTAVVDHEDQFAPLAGKNVYRVRVKVDSIYEKGMKAAAEKYPAVVKQIRDDFQRGAITTGEKSELWTAVQKARSESEAKKIVSDARRGRSAGSNNGFEEGSRIPDGWDSGHIDGEEEKDKDDTGSDTPDGQGNMAKRAAKLQWDHNAKDKQGRDIWKAKSPNGDGDYTIWDDSDGKIHWSLKKPGSPSGLSSPGTFRGWEGAAKDAEAHAAKTGRWKQAAPGGVTMHALIHNGRLLGATDNWNDARTWSYWSYGDRKLIADELRDEAVVMDLYGVPMPVAEVLMDVGTRAGRLKPEAAYRQAKPFMKDKGHKVASIDRTGRSGLYGFTKRVQADCESCVRKAQKAAQRIAKHAYGKSEKVAEFLSAHASRADSLPAQILVTALGEIGPKVAADMKRTARLEELRAQRGAGTVTAAPRGKAQEAIADHISGWKSGQSDNLTDISRGAAFRGVHFAKIMSAAEALKKQGLIDFDGVKVTKKAGGKTAATDKEGRSYGLYGFTDRVATLGLTACSEVRAEAGRIASDLHRRRTALHTDITAFLDTHCKTAECKYSRLLHASYPEGTAKLAAANPPRTVAAWLTWEV